MEGSGCEKEVVCFLVGEYCYVLVMLLKITSFFRPNQKDTISLHHLPKFHRFRETIETNHFFLKI